MADENPSAAEPKLVPLSELNEKVMCDFGHKFHANSALLIPFCNVTSASLGEVIFVNKENIVHMSLDSTPESGFFLACPVCKVIHIEGFSPIDGSEEALENEHQVPERNIQLGL